jgi:hypothetical protein
LTFPSQVSVREGKEGKYKILVHDRLTGKLVEEKIPEYIRVAMKMMYSTASGRFGKVKNVVFHSNIDSYRRSSIKTSFVTFDRTTSQKVQFS